MTVLIAETADTDASDTAQRLRGFGPAGLLSILLILVAGLAGPIVGSLAVLVWARLSRTPFAALGFTKPEHWMATLAGGAIFGVIFKLGMKAIIMPLLGAPPINMAYQFLTGNTQALPWIIATVLISAALGEEILYRGYMFERLGALLGDRWSTPVICMLVSTVLFAMAHYPNQGLPGVQQAAVGGLVTSGIFVWRRQIGLLISIHAAFDLTAVVLIYWNLEETVAHWFFH